MKNSCLTLEPPTTRRIVTFTLYSVKHHFLGAPTLFHGQNVRIVSLLTSYAACLWRLFLVLLIALKTTGTQPAHLPQSHSIYRSMPLCKGITIVVLSQLPILPGHLGWSISGSRQKHAEEMSDKDKDKLEQRDSFRHSSFYT
jgi:hypothetical protein